MAARARAFRDSRTHTRPRNAARSLRHPGPADLYRSQLQHVILEIGRRFDLSDVHIVGSSAILAVLPNPPKGAFTSTRDVDAIPPQDDERVADRISFVLGKASDFDLEHSYYAQGVSSATPI